MSNSTNPIDLDQRDREALDALQSMASQINAIRENTERMALSLETLAGAMLQFFTEPTEDEGAPGG